MSLNLNLCLLPGDGIGPEVVSEAEKTLRAVASRFGHRLRIATALLGGAAVDASGDPFPSETRAAVAAADAVLLGAVGGPQWEGEAPERRPERGLLALRKAMGVYANLRPVKVWPFLKGASALSPARVEGVDLLIVRELTGGLYFGEPKGISGEGPQREAIDTLRYTDAEIARVARLAFDLAQRRRGKVASVDKANVLASSRLWREVVSREGSAYPGVALEHQLVDSTAMDLVLAPSRYDVLVTENLFGDILSDLAAAIPGTIGLLPSASVGDAGPSGLRKGLFEPIHGSAPGLAGKGLANPCGTILSAAELLRWSFGLEEEAQAIETAVAIVLERGIRTPDLGGSARTGEVGDAIALALGAEVGASA
jgi:3-isopropylmalate dehydrogenase